MKFLELLAPARDLQIGIAAIDCGADAVYIAGPQFGARQAAGNPIKDIRDLCDYAHKFGVKIFVTLNTILYDEELRSAYKFMLECQEAGVDAIIVQDLAVVEMAKSGIDGFFTPLNIPLHASTQCAIRTPEQARFLENIGFSRLILERELSLEQIREIRKSVKCELEFFVHGALCVCYSGQCYLSEMIAGRSANRGSCIQACRSRYDLIDANGKILIKDKSLLSLKDYNLKNRLAELAEAGITSFKIEGRLKNESYVRNVVRDYSIALDRIVENGGYARESFGAISGGFAPDTTKTFNRGYTELFLDEKRGKWAAMDAAKSMGEHIGLVSSIQKGSIGVDLNKGVTLNNADGFSFISRSGSIEGFRGDICHDNIIKGRLHPSLYIGAALYRNINSSFEKDIERKTCTRELRVSVALNFSKIDSGYTLYVQAISEDEREVTLAEHIDGQIADNQDRMSSILYNQIEKSSGHYRFHIKTIAIDAGLPFMSASAINGIRRSLAEKLEHMPVRSRPLANRLMEVDGLGIPPSKGITYRQNVSNHLSENLYNRCGADYIEAAYELRPTKNAELMRTKYCIKYELGICPVHQGAKTGAPLFLINNGKRLVLEFDCKACEMVVKEA